MTTKPQGTHTKKVENHCTRGSWETSCSNVCLHRFSFFPACNCFIFFSVETEAAPEKRLEDMMRLGELCIEVLQQNDEHHSEVFYFIFHFWRGGLGFLLA